MKPFNSIKILLPLIFLLVSCSSQINPTSSNAKDDLSSLKQGKIEQEFDLKYYADTLQKYVNSSGQVNYEKLKNNRQKLDQFNAGLGAVTPEMYKTWTEEEKIAFWLNAYNSLTLESIINNYPVKSIRDIPGVWKGQKFNVMAQEMTLDQIEHEVLRKQFNEPRIHMALVCASIGCPPLKMEPYTGEKLDKQLAQQSRRFLSNAEHFRIDSQNKKVYVSSIFKWFGEDFEKTYGQSQNLKGLNPKETAFINFIQNHLNQTDQKYLSSGGYQITYLNYDWSLNNEQ